MFVIRLSEVCEMLELESCEGNTIFNIKVKAGAKHNLIHGWINGVDSALFLKISIKAAPENGKANEAIIKFLSSIWKIFQGDIEIISGHTNNCKKIKITGYRFKNNKNEGGFGCGSRI